MRHGVVINCDSFEFEPTVILQGYRDLCVVIANQLIGLPLYVFVTSEVECT